jgi:hypothetical protein
LVFECAQLRIEFACLGVDLLEFGALVVGQAAEFAHTGLRVTHLATVESAHAAQRDDEQRGHKRDLARREAQPENAVAPRRDDLNQVVLLQLS